MIATLLGCALKYVYLLGAICELAQFINCAAHFVDS